MTESRRKLRVLSLLDYHTVNLHMSWGGGGGGGGEDDQNKTN